MIVIFIVIVIVIVGVIWSPFALVSKGPDFYIKVVSEKIQERSFGGLNAHISGSYFETSIRIVAD